MDRKIISVKMIAFLAALLIIGSSSCKNASSKADTYCFSKSGIASVKVGEEYTAVPISYADLYTHAECLVCCGNEDGEGVEILYYDDNSEDFIICAILDADQAAIETLFEKELACNTYPIPDPQVEEVLKQTGSTTIGAVSVASSLRITVIINGQEMLTNEPAVKFMEMPGAITTASLGEGLCINCTIGELTMTIINAYEALSPEASSLIGKKLASAMETGMYEPIPVSAADVDPTAHFDYFSY